MPTITIRISSSSKDPRIQTTERQLLNADSLPTAIKLMIDPTHSMLSKAIAVYPPDASANVEIFWNKSRLHEFDVELSNPNAKSYVQEMLLDNIPFMTFTAKNRK